MPTAAQPDGVHVDTYVDPCVPVDEARFHRILAIELGTSMDSAANAARTQVRITCIDGDIELNLEDGVTRKSMRRLLRADSLGEGASTRLLALAVAEFIVASWIELSVTPVPSVEPVGVAPSADVVAGAREVAAGRQERAVRPSWRVSAGAGLSSWAGTVATLLPLALLRASYHPEEHPAIAWRVGGQFAYGIQGVRIGRIEIGQASLSSAMAYVHSMGPLDFELGVGGRIGAVRLSGEPLGQASIEGASTVAPHGGLLLNLALHYAPTSAFRVGVEGELGMMTWPVQAYASEDEPILELSGPWLSVALILGVGL